MLTIEQIINTWNSFFFEPIPVHNAALVRIALGVVLLYDALYLLVNIEEYLGPKGLIRYERYAARAKNRALSLFLYLPPTMFSVYLIMFAHIFFLVGMILGFGTVVCVPCVFVTLCSIVNRNPSICNGGDNVARTLCFLLIFASSGKVYSLDELFFFKNTNSNSYFLQVPWAIRLMQIQVSIIYLYTVYWKLKGATYRDGTAMYYAMNIVTYRRFSLPSFLLKKPFLQLLTWSALAIELSLGIGLWVKDYQIVCVLLGFALHLSIEYMLNVHLFSWYMMVALLVFIPPQAIITFWGGM